MTLQAASVLTIMGSVLMSVSWVLQKQAARRLPTIAGAPAGSTARAFLASGRWLAGVSLMIAGFGAFQFAVASTGEISVLQPMFSAGSVVLAVLAVVCLGERFSGGEWTALVFMAAAVVLLGLAAEPHPPRIVRGGIPLALLLAVALGALAWRQLLVPSVMMPPEIVLGMSGGMVQGIGLVLMGAYSVHERTGPTAWSPLLAACAVACFGVSFVTMQRGVQLGRALVVVTMNTVLTNLVAIVGGIVLLDETLSPNPSRRAMQATALATIVVASGALARLGVPADALGERR